MSANIRITVQDDTNTLLETLEEATGMTRGELVDVALPVLLSMSPEELAAKVDAHQEAQRQAKRAAMTASLQKLKVGK